MHTIYSDGSSHPFQNVIDAAMLGMNVIAITDHDIISGYYDALHEAINWNIKVISGVEISTTDYHILGYDFDTDNLALHQLLYRSRKEQQDIVNRRVEIIRSQGMPLTLDKVLEYSKNSRIGKGNIVRAMLRDPECRKHANGLNFSELHKMYLSKDSPACNMINYKTTISSKQAIDAIHAAGGIAVIAHPFKDVKNMHDLDELVREGIDGLEIQPNYGGKNVPFQEYALGHGLLITYGSDYHGSRMRKRPLLDKGENYIEQFWKEKEIRFVNSEDRLFEDTMLLHEIFLKTH